MLAIGSGLCCDCDGTRRLDQFGRCTTCGSDSILPRRIVEPEPYVPDEQTRLALNVETTPDDLVIP